MRNKFEFLLKDSLKKKINTKAFKLANIFICLALIVLINIDTVIKFFGGDFDDLVNIYVVDEVNVEEVFDKEMDSSIDVLKNYNAVITKTDKSYEELKQEMIDNESKDIIIHFYREGEISLENILSAEVISYDYIDSILYANINAAINNTKRSVALKEANVSEELLNSIYKEVEIDRILLDPDLNKNDELMEVLGAILVLIFILPFFMLIVIIVQMIGAEINEEKSCKGMEIIISSVSPQTHFLSKLVSSNLFALIQGALLIIYALIGTGVKFLITGPITLEDTVNNIALSVEVDTTSVDVMQVLTDNNVIGRLKDGLPVFIVLIVLTFIAYTLFIGILASVTTSMEDFNQIQTPVMIFLMAGYMLAIYASVFQGSTFLDIMSYVPLISGILAPVMYILGEISIYSLWISILLLIGLVYLLYKYGLKIYKVGILNYSSSNLWKKMLAALKEK